MRDQPKFVIFAHNATYDKLHQVATLGLTAAAMGKDVNGVEVPAVTQRGSHLAGDGQFRLEQNTLDLRPQTGQQHRHIVHTRIDKGDLRPHRRQQMGVVG